MLTIYIEDGFLNEFEKLPDNKSYGVIYLWELAQQEENNLFILDDYYFSKQTNFTKKLVNGNKKTKEIASIDNAHLLFVTEENRNKIKTSGMVFTLDDFERKIEEYANIENFIIFLENDAMWKDWLFDFKRFPHSDISLVDPYLFEHLVNTNIFKEAINPKYGVNKIDIYVNTENFKTQKNIDKALNLFTELNITYTIINTNKSNCDFNNRVNWHDREIVSDYAMVVTGIGFKNKYNTHTNNKLIQFNIFTKDGRNMIKKQKEKFEMFANT
ncbi:hypothetical protein OBJ93_12325 [Empedobacter falsenii]